jgi:NAD(P)-dependent dehydrogenase (short-subunit alcohol dehydrogenase family)
VRADLSRSQEVTERVRQVERNLGPVDVLVDNAGVTRPQPVAQITEADWDELLAVNLKSVFLLTQAVLPGTYESHFVFEAYDPLPGAFPPSSRRTVASNFMESRKRRLALSWRLRSWTSRGGLRSRAWPNTVSA